MCVRLANGSREITRYINSHLEASKIGRQIAEEVMDLQRKSVDSSSPSSTPSPTSRDIVADVSNLSTLTQ